MKIKQLFLRTGKQKIAVAVMELPKSEMTVLFLFGGSKKRGKERFFEWQRYLAHYHISSVSFDYTGTGQSWGNFYDSSLAKRIEESIFVLEWTRSILKTHQEIVICGGSMGAYIALGLTSILKEAVKNLVLFCPAAYAKEAHHTRFGPKFKQAISQPDSWRNSLGFDWIQEFRGRLLLLLPQQDQVIPADITQEFHQKATSASLIRKVIIENASHQLLAKGSKNRAIREEVYHQSVVFLK